MILKIWKHRIYVLQVCNLYKVTQIQAVLNRGLSIFCFLFSVSGVLYYICDTLCDIIFPFKCVRVHQGKQILLNLLGVLSLALS